MDNKKKITIAVAVVAVIITIAIILFLVNKNKNTIYTISFNTNGGEEVVSQQIKDGKTITKPSDPSKEGYEFLGWYLNEKEFDFSKPIDKNITLEAKWKEVNKDNEDKQDEDVNKDEDTDKDENEDKEEVTKYLVTFDSKGGSSVKKQTIEKGSAAKQPKNPTKSGYTFKGWYLGSSKFNFSTKITKNITLTAKWEKNEEKPNEEKPSEEKPSEEKPVEVKKYTITFDSNGGSAVAKQTVEENKTAKAPSNPTRSGYTFKGWYLGSSKFDFSTKVTSNITLTAKWEKDDVISYKIEKVTNSVMNQVRVFITLNGEKVAGTADVVNTQGETIKRDIPASGWLTFDGTIETLKNIKVK